MYIPSAQQNTHTTELHVHILMCFWKGNLTILSLKKSSFWKFKMQSTNLKMQSTNLIMNLYIQILNTGFLCDRLRIPIPNTYSKL